MSTATTMIGQPLVWPSSFQAPTTMQGVLNAVGQYVLYSFPSGTVLSVSGPNTPAVDDQNKIWFETDPSGRPIKIMYFYNGNWRQFYTGKPYEVSMFIGNWPTFFDTTGLGTLGLGWDGWAIANGQNGTTDITNKFIVPGYRCDGIGAWVTNVTGSDTYTGGETTITIQPWNLPPLAVTLNQSAIRSQGGTTTALVPGGGTPVTFAVNGIAGTQTPIPCLPPYIAVGFAEFIGYTL
jgi:hypothetical protein